MQLVLPRAQQLVNRIKTLEYMDYQIQYQLSGDSILLIVFCEIFFLHRPLQRPLVLSRTQQLVIRCFKIHKLSYAIFTFRQFSLTYLYYKAVLIQKPLKLQLVLSRTQLPAIGNQAQRYVLLLEKKKAYQSLLNF